MNLSPDALCQPRIRNEKVEIEINHLATQIKNSPNNHEDEFEIIIGDTGLTADEGVYVCEQFEDAGWAHVSRRSSRDYGERGGLMVYTFRKHFVE